MLVAGRGSISVRSRCLRSSSICCSSLVRSSVLVSHIGGSACGDGSARHGNRRSHCRFSIHRTARHAGDRQRCPGHTDDGFRITDESHLRDRQKNHSDSQHCGKQKRSHKWLLPNVLRYEKSEIRISKSETSKGQGSGVEGKFLVPRHSSLDTSSNSFRLRHSLGQAKELDFLGPFRWHENKLFIRHLRSQVPTSNDYRKLWLAFDLFRRQNKFARQRLVAVFNPHLPVNIRPAKREMSRLRTRNDAGADHKPGRGRLQHLFGGVLVEQVRTGRDHVELLPGEVERLVQGRRRRGGGVY